MHDFMLGGYISGTGILCPTSALNFKDISCEAPHWAWPLQKPGVIGLQKFWPVMQGMQSAGEAAALHYCYSQSLV